MSTWAQAGPVALDILRPYAGDPLPDTLARHSGLVVLGGGMGAYDSARFPWLGPTQRLIADAVLHDLPFLGICLGHQLAAVALGGAVGLRPTGPAAGVVAMTATAALPDDPLFGGLSTGTHTVAWNHDVVSQLPTGATVLATDPDGFAHLVRFAPRAWGMQFHPEVTPEIVETWANTKPLAPRAADEAPVAQLVAQVRRELPAIQERWREPLESFFALTAT